jgi:hypothetical protein
MPMPGLGKRFDEFIAILGYEKVNILSELPPELRRLLGLE